jgi:uncharacterized membrane protein
MVPMTTAAPASSVPLAARPRIALAAGIVAIALGNFVTSVWFDHRAWGWLGFMTAKPITEDYVPLFPWIGVMLIGIAAGHALVRNDFRAVAPFARLPGVFAWLGRHSLAVYMLHQPLLIGLLYLVVRR